MAGGRVTAPTVDSHAGGRPGPSPSPTEPPVRPLPRLRDDLVVSEQPTATGTAFVVKDPVTGRFYRFREPEHFIARQLDGATPLDTVGKRSEERFGAALAPGSLEAFVEKLRRLGLLEVVGERRGHGEGLRGPGRVRGNPFLLRVKVLDPDRLFTWLAPRVRIFFTPASLVLSAGVLLLACGVTVANWDAIGRDLLRLYRPEVLILAWLTVFAITTAHEFAHGLTCKRFGGEVHELGFLLIYFQPAFYCNVTEAWLFPQRSRRLWVTFAGAYFEIVLWALATLAWRVTDRATPVSDVALVVMTTSGIKTLFNLNPLIKLDGYYLLSDALDVPNLRARAFRYLGGLLRRPWASGPAGRQATARERRIYLVYGVLAAVYSVSLLGLVAFYVGRFLVDRYQGTGAVLFVALLAAIFHKPLRAGLRRTVAVLGSPRAMLPAVRSLLKFLVPVAGLAALLFLVWMDLTVSGEFKILPAHNADVRAEIDGIIAEVAVQEGDRVGAGALIARLSQLDYRAELRKIEAEVREKQAKLRMLRTGPRREEIDLARETVATAQTRVEHARRRHAEADRVRTEEVSRSTASLGKAEERLEYATQLLTMYENLFERELIARKQLIEAREAVAVRRKELEEARAEAKRVATSDLSEHRKALAVAEKELREAEARLRLLLAGSRPEEVEATEAEIARLESQRGYRQEQLRLASVASPIAGIVTTPKLKEKVGQFVKKGDLIAEVHALSTVTAEIPISEKEIADVRIGQPVVLKARAYPERSFQGVVTAIAPAAVKEEGGGSLVRVTTEIDNSQGLLKPEMTGHAKIRAGERRLLDLLTRRLARYVRVEFWSWW